MYDSKRGKKIFHESLGVELSKLRLIRIISTRQYGRRRELPLSGTIFTYVLLSFKSNVPKKLLFHWHWSPKGNEWSVHISHQVWHKTHGLLYEAKTSSALSFPYLSLSFFSADEKAIIAEHRDKDGRLKREILVELGEGNTADEKQRVVRRLRAITVEDLR